MAATTAEPWYASPAWPAVVANKQCIEFSSHRGYTAEVWAIRDAEGNLRYAGRVTDRTGHTLPGSVHLSVNELVAETGAMAHLAGILTGLPAEPPKQRLTPLRVLLRRTGKPPRISARRYPVGVAVESGGYRWVSNRYVDSERPFWQRSDKVMSKP